jgi:hypothetical protein
MKEIMYLCRGTNPVCKSSPGCMVDCKHTRDISYAKNFEYISQDGPMRNGSHEVYEYFVEEEHNEEY